MVKGKVEIAVFDNKGKAIVRKRAKMELHKKGLIFSIRYKPKKEKVVTALTVYLNGELWRGRRFKEPVPLEPNKLYEFVYELLFMETVDFDIKIFT